MFLIIFIEIIIIILIMILNVSNNIYRDNNYNNYSQDDDY